MKSTATVEEREDGSLSITLSDTSFFTKSASGEILEGRYCMECPRCTHSWYAKKLDGRCPSCFCYLSSKKAAAASKGNVSSSAD